jgi:hypothetical protein
MPCDTDRAAFFVQRWFARHTIRKANRMTRKASRATFNLYELQMNAAPPSGDERDAILDLDDDAFRVELEKYVVRGELGGAVDSNPVDFGNASYYSRLTSEGLRLATERHERQSRTIRDAWQPDDISEADQWPEPLRTVVAFRLLCGQYVAIAGNSMASLADHWKRSRLCDTFSPMADDVAAAMVAANEDPKGLFRALSFCNETDQVRFVDAWRGEILPTLKTVEIKLKNSTSGTATTSGEAPTTNEQPEVITAPAVVAATTNGKAVKKPGGRPRKTRRDPTEAKVIKYRKANPKMMLCDIDDELGLEPGESARICERVRKRELNASKADKTGQN